MQDTNNNHDLFSASLEGIETSKRIEKFERFKNDFQRECMVTLDNAQEWIKAELPIVTDYIDANAIKDELKQSKTSSRRKHLLSALLFEKNLREAIENNTPTTAAMLAMQMFNCMWLAKVELDGKLPAASASPIPDENASDSAIQTYNDTREKILTTLIEKGEKLKRDSQIQSNIKPRGAPNPAAQDTGIQQKTQTSPAKSAATAKRKPTVPNTAGANSAPATQKSSDLWSKEAEKSKNAKRIVPAKNKKSKKKSNGVFAKVKTKIPLKRKSKQNSDRSAVDNPAPVISPEDSLLENPNRSAIIVNPGFSESIDDSLIQARKQATQDPNESGLTVHKVLKKRDHEKQDPGSNTIIMKLASNTGKRAKGKLSIPEQCQDAINLLTQQFPGYDMVAIRHMAAEKVGVSPQYIENLNILPDKQV